MVVAKDSQTDRFGLDWGRLPQGVRACKDNGTLLYGTLETVRLGHGLKSVGIC
jgi:hypothetical protein